jgi:hypothetical protein
LSKTPDKLAGLKARQDSTGHKEAQKQPRMNADERGSDKQFSDLRSSAFIRG